MVIRTAPLSQAEKNQTSKNICFPISLVLCNVVFLHMTTLMCVFSVTVNIVLVNLVGFHLVLYEM